MKLFNRLAALLLMLLILPFSGCNDTEVRRAAKASVSIANTLDALTDAKRELKAAGLIDDAEDLSVTTKLLAATRSAKKFNAQVKAYADRKEFDANAKLELSTLFSDVTKDMADLTRDGSLSIKNPQARSRIAGFLDAISASVSIISEVLNAKA